MSEKYNGYINYETRLVCLWLDNKQAEYEYWKEQAKITSDDYELGQNMKAHYQEQADTMISAPGLIYDLVHVSLNQVNWTEVAKTRRDE